MPRLGHSESAVHSSERCRATLLFPFFFCALAHVLPLFLLIVCGPPLKVFRAMLIPSALIIIAIITSIALKNLVNVRVARERVYRA